MATSTQVDALVALYAGYFNRAPDPAGLQFWIDQIDGGREFNTIAADFAASAEATALYPYLTAPDVAAPSTFITSIYQNLFNRTPDQAGLDFWTDVLAQGSVSVADMIEAIINGAVDAPNATPATFDATTLENKIEVGRDFAVDAANTTGFEFDAAAKSAAVAAIDGVTNDEATVVAAKAATDAYLAGEANQGDTFVLTTGADNVVGTADNDTINALTVNASGAAATTFSAFDTIDGGAGKDTLNIFADGTSNGAFPTSATVKNVETININNINATGFGAVDASNFQGATQIWQAAFSNDVSKLEATTTAGLKNVTLSANANQAGVGTTATARSIAATDAAASINVALNGVKGDAAAAVAVPVGPGTQGLNATVQNQAALNLSGKALANVNVSGSLAQATTTAGAAAASLALGVTLGKDVQAATVNTGVATVLTIENEMASTKALTSVDASASTGNVTYVGADAQVATVKGGAGDDTLTIATATVKDNAATAADETVSALVEGGAGKDNITINTTAAGTGTTTVNAGEGDDMVTLTQDGTGKLSVDLGAGNDSFKGTGTVSGTDMIDGGAGTDSLLLSMVGAANIGAFTNFEVFDAAGLGKTLDVDILASKNTVTEFTASADVGTNAVLTNVGAGVGYRVTGDTVAANAMTLTQKTAGALTVTLDIDEPATTAANFDSGAAINVDAAVIATNATSINAVFDSSFKDKAVDNTDNLTNLTITGNKATTLDVVSGGEHAINDLDYTTDSAAGKSILTGVTVSGDRALNLDLAITGAGTNEVATVNASAHTGGLTFDLDDLKATGTLSLGSGDDMITAQDGLTATASAAADAAAAIAAHRVINGIEKGSAEDLTIQSNFDVVTLAGAVQAADQAATATLTVKDGLLTFNGAGPATLDAAVELAAGQLGANEAVVFEFVGNSYIYAEGATDGGVDDVLIKLDATVGLAGLDDVNDAGSNLYVF